MSCVRKNVFFIFLISQLFSPLSCASVSMLYFHLANPASPILFKLHRFFEFKVFSFPYEKKKKR
jgi:hypothetical protein